MVRSLGAAVSIVLLCASVVLTSACAGVRAQAYQYSVDAVLVQSDYRLYTMVLDEEDELTVAITATGGLVDIYLMTAQGTSEFLSIITTGSTSATWSYIPEMSQLGTNQFSDTFTIEEQSTYSVAILNNESSPVTITGIIISQIPEQEVPADWTWVVVAIGVGAVAALLVVILILIPRTYRLQAELDSNTRVSLGDELEPPLPRIGFGGKCPFCGSRNPQGSMFCGSCGERIG